jgi:hypothetical protein
MYRIIKRIVHTVTTVTWLVRLEERTGGDPPIEKEITFPANHSLIEEEVSDPIHIPKQAHPSFKQDLDKGEKS